MNKYENLNPHDVMSGVQPNFQLALISERNDGLPSITFCFNDKGITKGFQLNGVPGFLGYQDNRSLNSAFKGLADKYLIPNKTPSTQTFKVEMHPYHTCIYLFPEENPRVINFSYHEGKRLQHLLRIYGLCFWEGNQNETCVGADTLIEFLQLLVPQLFFEAVPSINLNDLSHIDDFEEMQFGYFCLPEVTYE